MSPPPYLAAGPAVVVDEGGGAEPQLGAVLAAGVHDGEVVLAGLQQLVLLLVGEFRDAAHQQRHLLPLRPDTQNLHVKIHVKVKIEGLNVL